MARQTREQLHESRRLGGQNSAANRQRYPKGHPQAGQLLPRAADPPTPPAAPLQPPPPAAPAPPERRRLNPLTATPRDVVDRILGR